MSEETRIALLIHVDDCPSATIDVVLDEISQGGLTNTRQPATPAATASATACATGRKCSTNIGSSRCTGPLERMAGQAGRADGTCR
jgi:hypothetical protein